MVDQKKGSEKFVWSEKNHVRFNASVSYLSELIGYENSTDCLEILPEDSYDINLTYRVRDFLNSHSGLRHNPSEYRNIKKASHGFDDKRECE